MKQLIFHTFAYNAEATLPRTIDSVLGQTRSDWLWHLVDNGSTDSTGEIIREAARRDGRVIALANKVNHVWEPGNSWWDIAWKYEENDCFCMLDADDEYKPEFAERMLAFMEAGSLDIAACGFDFIDAPTGKMFSKRVAASQLIIEGSEYAKHFSQCYKFMRAMWCKLYRMSVLRKYDFSRAGKHLVYGGDTQITIECFRNAGRVGILDESLHRYYVYPKSVSTTWDDRRVEADVTLDDMARDFLVAKCGEVSKENDEFLLGVYFSAIRDTLEVLLGAQLPAEAMTGALHGIFTSGNTCRLIAWQGRSEEKKEIFDCAAQLLLLLLDGAEPGLAALGVEVLAAMYPGREHPLLDNMSPGLTALVPAAVCFVMCGRYAEALERFLAESEGAEIDDADAEAYIRFGQNLAAAAEDIGVYVYFRKIWVSYLLDNSRFDEAAGELDELEGILPGDEEVSDLRRDLEKRFMHEPWTKVPPSS